MDEALLIARQLERERRARKSAETLLESKSLELYEANQALLHLNATLERHVHELEEANEGLRSEIELRKDAERQLKIYAEVIRSTGEAVAITDLNGKIIEANPAYEYAVGRTREEVIGTSLYGTNSDPDSEDPYRELWRALDADGHWTGEVLDRRSNGEPFPSWALINAVRDERGDPVHYVCVSRDITALKQSEHQLQKLAFYDSLTSLPNRALFNDRLSIALASAERQQSLIAVIYLDLDRFKYVNDTLGHPAGDRLLVEIGQRISRCIRTADTLARMGGDEFTILLTHLGSEADAVRTAERIVEVVGMPVQLGKETVYVGVSIGISFYPAHGQDAETLQKNADLAMYEAKEGGRSQYRVFSPEMLTRSNERPAIPGFR
jgi:diguanylate cyclase (GGDEF)-like protein/PAS domain S-box-containing protein